MQTIFYRIYYIDVRENKSFFFIDYGIAYTEYNIDRYADFSQVYVIKTLPTLQ